MIKKLRNRPSPPFLPTSVQLFTCLPFLQSDRLNYAAMAGGALVTRFAAPLLSITGCYELGTTEEQADLFSDCYTWRDYAIVEWGFFVIKSLVR
jgi:hypothetical protein